MAGVGAAKTAVRVAAAAMARLRRGVGGTSRRVRRVVMVGTSVGCGVREFFCRRFGSFGAGKAKPSTVTSDGSTRIR